MVLVFLQRGQCPLLGGVRRLVERRVLSHRIGSQEATATRLTTGTEFVHPLRQRSALVLQRNRVAVVIDRSEGLVQLDIGTVREPLEDAGLDAVGEHVAVTAL